MRLIDADALSRAMYHEAFEKDTDLQKWDSGCWIRYKMFENKIEEAPTVDVLDNLRAEIKDRLYVNSPIFRELIDYRNGKITTDDVIEKFNRVTRQEVLQIIDKYTKEDKE